MPSACASIPAPTISGCRSTNATSSATISSPTTSHRVKEGGFYGWPIAYIGPHPEPRHKNIDMAKVKSTLYPDVILGGHVGPLDILFYTGTQFPAKYRGGMFVALHGSWNRAERQGYKIAYIPFHDKTDRGSGGLSHRLDAGAGQEGSVGPAGGSAADAGRLAARERRWRPEDLANLV